MTEPWIPQDFINGAFHECKPWENRRLQNPSTGQDLQPMVQSEPDAVDEAIGHAVFAHEHGILADVSTRVEILTAIAAEAEKLALKSAEQESLNTGAVIATTSMLSFITHAAFNLAAAQLADGGFDSELDGPNGNPVSVLRLPWGPAALLVPWNAPAPMAAHKMASAIAAGAPSILKPSEFAPNGSQVIAKAAEAAGVPNGVVQIVNGGPSVGGQLVTDPRIRSVSFTGGLQAGREIAKACAVDFKPAQLELGGNNPVVVMPDADTDEAADGIVALLTQLNGQWCRALGRLIIPAKRHHEILDAVGARLAEIKIGDALDHDSQMGPIVHSGHLELLKKRIAELEQLGGTAHIFSSLPDGPGNWLAPTLVTGVDSDNAVDEIFGPVATVHPYRNPGEAIALANATPFGLEGYVFGTDLHPAMKVARQIRAGGVKVNGSTMLSLNLMAPRPAWGLSGFAEEGTLETIRFFCGTRVVGVEGPTA